jgi:hypothetical protein
VIAKNSPGDTKAKNTGIFWSWFNTSMLVGNVFLYFYLGEKYSDFRWEILGFSNDKKRSQFREEAI